MAEIQCTPQPAGTVSLRVFVNGVLSNEFAGIAWSNEMNAQDALELAFDSHKEGGGFDYFLRYFGRNLGYMVTAIDDVSDDNPKIPKARFWMFYVNCSLSPHGIDHEELADGDVVDFRFEAFEAEVHTSEISIAKTR
jgi:hypothetical protein